MAPTLCMNQAPVPSPSYHRTLVNGAALRRADAGHPLAPLGGVWHGGAGGPAAVSSADGRWSRRSAAGL
jgi:hypothetical protein